MEQSTLQRVMLGGNVDSDLVEEHQSRLERIAEVDLPDKMGSQIVNINESLEDSILIFADEIPREGGSTPQNMIAIDPQRGSWHVQAIIQPDLVEEFADIFDVILNNISIEITDLDIFSTCKIQFRNLNTEVSLPSGFEATGIQVSQQSMTYIFQSSTKKPLDSDMSELMEEDESETDSEEYTTVISSIDEELSPSSGDFIPEKISEADSAIERMVSTNS